MTATTSAMIGPGPVINCCTNDGWSAGVPAAACAHAVPSNNNQITSLRSIKNLITGVHFS